MKSYFRSVKFIVSGFTLLELLLASAMTLVVVTLTGVGVANMTRGNVKTNLESQMQYSLNRSLEFISNEVRNATKIEAIPSGSYTGLPSGATAIFKLTVPTLTDPIVYYSMVQPTQGQWLLGPVVLYRWGPKIDSSGKYTDVSNPVKVPVVDMLSNTSLSDSEKCSGSNKKYGASQSGGTQTNGFYVCVIDEKLAQLHLVSTVRSTKIDDTITKRVDSQAFARSAIVSFDITSGQPVTRGAATVAATKLSPPDPPSSSSGLPVTVKGTSDLAKTLNPSNTLYNQPANTKIVVGSPGTSTTPSLYSSSTSYVQIATNGSDTTTLPSLPWTTSPLSDYYDSGKVKLPPNQIIVIVDYDKYIQKLKSLDSTLTYTSPGNIAVLLYIK